MSRADRLDQEMVENKLTRAPNDLPGSTIHAMPASGDPFGLRLAAKAADREQVAQQQWPAFERRLRALGYTPRSIAHAFSILSGPGTVTEALDALERATT